MRQGNIFTGICHSVHRGGIHGGGMHGRGACMVGGTCMAGGMCGRGACVVGGMHGILEAGNDVFL